MNKPQPQPQRDRLRDYRDQRQQKPQGVSDDEWRVIGNEQAKADDALAAMPG